MASSKDVAIIFSCCLFFHGLSKAACGKLFFDYAVKTSKEWNTLMLVLFCGKQAVLTPLPGDSVF